MAITNTTSVQRPQTELYTSTDTPMKRLALRQIFLEKTR